MQMSSDQQADLFGFSPPVHIRQQRSRGHAGRAPSIDDFRGDVDDALQALGRDIDRAIETLRDALCTVEGDEAREAIEEAIEELDIELASVLSQAKIEIGL
ncbi:hypothetical protein [Mesorhizobium sp.]|uniref:hypothetical protein n=1 Tax=Mesorhizobium sp. TaxID=1871066 RepID=UPI0012088E69|nr:hypothetical protein [Mesorhizobium sp.]TIO36532.1 MAG: hypothetical protein E5X89_00510 [Mesorhizobium sp.]